MATIHGDGVINGTAASDNIYGGANGDTISAGDGNNNVYAGGGDDTITAGSGNDNIDGGAGADSMAGGDGNDVYYVDNVGDLVIENANEGNDTVKATISYTLTANVERLDLIDITALLNTPGN